MGAGALLRGLGDAAAAGGADAVCELASNGRSLERAADAEGGIREAAKAGGVYMPGGIPHVDLFHL